MTLETFHKATEELVRRGIPATLEYPGQIHVVCGPITLVAGDANQTFDIDVNDADWTWIETIESSIPADSTDVETIADFIACSYTQAMEVQSG